MMAVNPLRGRAVETAGCDGSDGGNDADGGKWRGCDAVFSVHCNK
jgi:hypothetical protein